MRLLFENQNLRLAITDVKHGSSDSFIDVPTRLNEILFASDVLFKINYDAELFLGFSQSESTRRENRSLLSLCTMFLCPILKQRRNTIMPVI